MARSNTGSTTNFFLNASTPITAAPLTMACWFNLANVTSSNNLMAIENSASNVSYFALTAEGTAGGDPIQCITQKNTAGPEGIAASTTGFSANTWQHAAGVWRSNIDRSAYLNGGNRGNDATDRTPAGLNQMTLGMFKNSGGSFSAINGRIARPAMWNTDLNDEELLQLANGADPSTVRPDNLVAYWPLWDIETGDATDQHIVGSTRYLMTENGTMGGGTGDDPPVSLFSQFFWNNIPQVAPPPPPEICHLLPLW